MVSINEYDDRAQRIARLRAACEAASRVRPSDAIAARSRALLELVLSLLEGARDEPQGKSRAS